MLSREELERGEGGESGWLATGLLLEEEQYADIFLHSPLCSLISRFQLRTFRRSLGAKPNVSKALELTKQRQRLRTRMDNFTAQSKAFLQVKLQPSSHESQRQEDILSEDDDWFEDETEAAPIANSGDPENQPLPFPSAFPTDIQRGNPRLRRLCGKEKTMREGQANDSLEKVREAVSHLSFQFKGKVRTAASTKQTTRAWDGVNLLSRELRTQRRIYNHSRRILIDLSGKPRDDYPLLTEVDCHVSTVITEPNAAGQSQKGLAWFWTQAGGTMNTDNYMTECEAYFLTRWYGHNANVI